jgi:hypothetical protein
VGRPCAIGFTELRQCVVRTTCLNVNFFVYDVYQQIRILHHAGFDVLEPYIIYSSKEADINDVTGQWSARLDNIWNDTAVQPPQ